MLPIITINVNKVEPSYACQELNHVWTGYGDYHGKKKFGDSWQGMLSPSEEKLRILATKRSNHTLDIDVTPYPWSDLQKMRQVQPNTIYDTDDQRRYLVNAVALTVNGLIETTDSYLVFHRKKGGAKEGSIHTFGGYVIPDDLDKGGLVKALTRELTEKSEIGLNHDEFSVDGFFGTSEGLPSILWDFRTGAVYGRVKTQLTHQELQQRLEKISGEENLERKLHIIACEDVKSLRTLDNIHPQTKQVVETIVAIYS